QGRKIDLPEAGARARAQETKVVADLGELDCASLEHARELYEHARVGRRLHEIGCGDELDTDDLRAMLPNGFRVAGRSGDPSADCGLAHVGIANERLRFDEQAMGVEDA